MSTTVTYKGSTLATVNNNTKTLKTAGKYMEGDVVLTDVSGGTAAISVVDTTDSHGGTIREITALDISDTTAVASDVAQGKYFYTAAGVKTAGTGSGGSGGGSKQEKTGTITGNGTNVIQISCDFEPQEIYIHGDLTSDVSLRGIISFILIKDRELVITQDSSTSGTPNNAWIIKTITGYNEEYSSTEPYASYSNGVLTIDTVMNSGSVRWPSGVSYSYSLVTYESVATDHVIHLEFSDSTDTDINVYYNDALLGTMITNYTPNTWTYSNKTVMLAELDGTAWYDKTTIPIGVELVDFTKLTNDTAIGNNGEIKSEQYYCTTDYMPIQSDMTFTFSCLMWSRIGFFDSNYESVGVASPYGSNWATQRQNETNYCDGTLTGSIIPSNAAFVVLVSTNNADSDHLSFIRTA